VLFLDEITTALFMATEKAILLAILGAWHGVVLGVVVTGGGFFRLSIARK
jgi:hypothetical protein